MADLLAAISVLLVFLTLLLGGMQKDSELLLKTTPPPAAQESNYNDFRGKVRWQIFKSFIITVIFLLIFWTLLPHTVKIMGTSKFAPWNFDELPTVFVLIETGILGMFVFGSIYVIRLFIHLPKKIAK